MKIDVDYLKTILDKFIESETQYIETSIFNDFLEDEKFLFHWDILLDKKLILNLQDNLGKFYSKTYNNIAIFHTKVRLNAYGYDFYEALKEEEFRNKIKNGLSDIGIDTLLNLSKKYIDKKVDTLF
ncbi:DUF2513 domain-containing protein [Aliarcobacter butzleri]|uniref:Uncharacterized protein n=1 Tax=Aliarcobacter butzleri L352 TaxID=1447260 RepID=A0A837JE25_9BACT|nr:DUF2513 domain-containing protein [Aliarcobacter butzleri]KLE06061.1 hypothetical protein AF77_03110 [Aliarcobacter butzleri L352]